MLTLPRRTRSLGGVAVAALAALAFIFAACGDDGEGGATPTQPPATAAANATPTTVPLSGDLTVFAAASLTAAFEDAGAAFEAANPGVEVTFNFGGSPALRTQLEQGAAADVLAVADTKNMQAAIDKDLVADGGTMFTRNRLVIAVPADNPGGITSPAELAKGGLKIVLAQEDVPVGAYARESLGKLEADASYGAGFRDRVLANVVSNEPNVKAVVTKVQLGEADAGIVYATDITAGIEADVTSVEIPEQFNVIAEYPVAVTTNASERDIAQAFIAFLLSGDGQDILAKQGFIGVE